MRVRLRMAAVVVLGMGCVCTAGAGTAPAGGALKAVLRDAGLAGDEVDRVVGILPAGAVASAETDLGKMSAAQKKELGAFVGMFKPELAADAKHDYWFDYCLMTGLERAASGKTVDAAAVADQKTFVAGAAAQIHDKLLDVLPAAQRAVWKAAIDKGADGMEKDLEARVAVLGGETFCPAFKAAFTEKLKTRMTNFLAEDGLYPTYGVSWAGHNAEDTYRVKLDAFFRETAKVVACEMFDNDTSPGFDPNPYWGYMTYGGQSTDGHWPSDVSGTPNAMLNDARGWKAGG